MEWFFRYKRSVEIVKIKMDLEYCPHSCVREGLEGLALRSTGRTRFSWTCNIGRVEDGMRIGVL